MERNSKVKEPEEEKASPRAPPEAGCAEATPRGRARRAGLPGRGSFPHPPEEPRRGFRW